MNEIKKGFVWRGLCLSTFFMGNTVLGDMIGCIFHVFVDFPEKKVLFDNKINLCLMIQSVVKKQATFCSIAFSQENSTNCPCSNILGPFLCDIQCFMQDKIIASHTCFGGHMDVNC